MSGIISNFKIHSFSFSPCVDDTSLKTKLDHEALKFLFKFPHPPFSLAFQKRNFLSALDVVLGKTGVPCCFEVL